MIYCSRRCSRCRRHSSSRLDFSSISSSSRKQGNKLDRSRGGRECIDRIGSDRLSLDKWTASKKKNERKRKKIEEGVDLMFIKLNF